MPQDFPKVEVRSREVLRAWLEANHSQSGSIWLVTYKKAAGSDHLPYDAIVEEALAFGWVDSLPRALDDRRTMLRLSPRKPRSGWSAVNKARIERLIAEGRMHPAGLEKIESAKRDGSWTLLDAASILEVPVDLSQALAAHPPATKNFEAFPPSTRRAILEWIAQARTDETRARRIADTAEKAAQNIRANQTRPPKSR